MESPELPPPRAATTGCIDELEARLGAGAMDQLRDLGLQVTDPHTWRLGGHGPLDDTVAAACRFDPDGLLNPGMLSRPLPAATADASALTP